MHLRSSGKIFCARIILALAFAFSAPAQSLDKFEFSTITTDKVAFVPFRVLISARSSTGALVRGYTGTPSLTASLDGFPIPIEALSKFQFTNGQWSGNLVFTKPGNGVIITVSGNARTNSTAPLNVAPPNFRVLNLPVISLASDLTRGVLYASVGPTNAGFGIINTIDPATGDTIATHNVFGGVERIELTDDASKLYVVSEDQLKVRRLRLPDFEEEAIISLGESEPGVPNYARDVAAHPTDPNTVAIVKGRRNLSPWYIGFSVFEGTVEKKISNQFFSSATVLHWGEKPNRLYGHDNQTSPTDFTQFDVGDTEIVPVASRRNLLNFFFGDIEVSAGKLYCSTGRIIDPEALTLLGELPNGHQDAVMLASPERKRIVYFTPAALGLMTTFDSDTLQALGSEPFPMPRGYGSGAAFWGNNGIALHDTKRLYLIENELLPSIAATADLQVTAGASQPAAEVAVDHQLKAFVKNLGPDAATSVLIRVSGPVDTVLSAATVAGRNATTTITDRSIRLEFDSLAPSEEVEVRFIARSAVAAWQPFGVIATSAAIDPNGTNNSANVLLKAAPLPAGDSQLTLRLGTTDVVADRGRGTILVAASGSTAPNANSIIAINPSTGDVSQPVLVGSRPVRLAISDDGNFLYVGFQGIAEVRRFTLPGLQPSSIIPLGREGFSGPYFGNYIAVRPGHPSDIAVARSTHSAASTTAQPEQFAYYHDATEIRPDRGTPHLLEFVDADHLLTYDRFGILHWFDVTDQTITWNKIFHDINAGNADGMEYFDGKLFFNSGLIYNADTGVRAGQFSFIGPSGPGPIIDAASKRALLLLRGISEQVVSAFDIETLVETGGSLVKVNPGSLTGFTRWSDNGFALAGTTAVAIWHTDLLARPPDEMKIAETILAGDQITFRFSKLSPGLYVFIQAPALGGEWTAVGDTFRETTTEISVPTSDAQKFYQLIKF